MVHPDLGLISPLDYNSLERMLKQVEDAVCDFQDNALENSTTAIVLPDSARLAITSISCMEPNLIIIDGAMSNGSHSRVLFHKSQLRLQLITVSCEDFALKKKPRIGFHYNAD